MVLCQHYPWENWANNYSNNFLCSVVQMQIPSWRKAAWQSMHFIFLGSFQSFSTTSRLRHRVGAKMLNGAKQTKIGSVIHKASQWRCLTRWKNSILVKPNWLTKWDVASSISLKCFAGKRIFPSKLLPKSKVLWVFKYSANSSFTLSYKIRTFAV